MAVEVNTDRRGVEIKWDAAKVGAADEEVEIRSENPDTGDVSTRKVKNDGLGTVTYPGDYTGKSNISVKGSLGSDSGTISV